MIFYYIRHGDPIYDPDGLTPLGQEQARAVAKRLALHGIDEIYASSANRAILTAQPTAELTKKEITVLDWCNEIHACHEFGVVPAGKSWRWCYQDEDYRKLFNSADMRRLGDAWLTHPALKDTKFSNGIDRIQRESDAFFASLGYERDPQTYGYRAVAPHDRRVALFAHQGFGMVFLSCVLGIPYPFFCTHFDHTHSGVTVIEFRNNGEMVIPKVLQVSNDSHLYKEGLPTRYANEMYI